MCRIYASGNYIITDSGNGLVSVQRQAIFWTNVGLLVIWPLVADSSVSRISIYYLCKIWIYLGRIKLANSVKPTNTNVTLYLKSKKPTTKNRCDIWKAVSKYTRSVVPHNTPSADDFFELFKDLAQGRAVEYFNHDYEKCALDFLNRYNEKEVSLQENRCLKLQIINDNFTESEISDTIDSLKN